MFFGDVVVAIPFVSICTCGNRAPYYLLVTTPTRAGRGVGVSLVTTSSRGGASLRQTGSSPTTWLPFLATLGVLHQPYDLCFFRVAGAGFLFFFRYRVIATATPGVALGNALHAQPHALEWPPLIDSFHCVC